MSKQNKVEESKVLIGWLIMFSKSLSRMIFYNYKDFAN